MIKNTKSSGGFWKKLRNHYRFQIIDTQSYDVKWVLELSRLNVLTFFSLLFLLLLAISFALFSLTPLRFLLPGYVGTNADDKRAVIQLKMKTEELEHKIAASDAFIKNLQHLVQDSLSLPHHTELENSETRILKADEELFFPQPSNVENKFRKDFEILLQKGDKQETSGKAYLLSRLKKPLDGRPIPQEDMAIGSKSLPIKGKSGAGITSVYAGVVFAKYKVGKEVHIYIQHDDYLISSYRFEGNAEVQQGEKIDIGQLIGSLAEEGSNVLHVNLWGGGEELPPGQYLKY